MLRPAHPVVIQCEAIYDILPKALVGQDMEPEAVRPSADSRLYQAGYNFSKFDRVLSCYWRLKSTDITRHNIVGLIQILSQPALFGMCGKRLCPGKRRLNDVHIERMGFTSLESLV